MGVMIYACKIKERVCGLVSADEMDALYEKYDAQNKDILILKQLNQYDDFLTPFEEGVYVYECGKGDVSMSYGGNDDFLTTLERVADDVDDDYAFDTTLSASGIDHCISYKVAEEMLGEFEKYKEQAKKCFIKDENDDYGEFLWECYNRYTEVLRECVELKGIVRYH